MKAFHIFFTSLSSLPRPLFAPSVRAPVYRACGPVPGFGQQDGAGRGVRMERPSSSSPGGASQPPPPAQHEPISFGIDQILSGAEPESSQLAGGSDASGGSFPLGSPSAAGAAPYTALPGSFHGITASFEDSGSYGLNLTLTPGGVIRVPAHRPLAASVPPPLASAVPGFGSLSFPWMESSHRFAKERFAGKEQTKRRCAQSIICLFVWALMTFDRLFERENMQNTFMFKR